MTEKGQIYVCEICGNEVQVLEAGAGTLVCCGQDMTLLELSFERCKPCLHRLEHAF